MKSSDQDQLRRDWYGPRTAGELATRYGISVIYVRKFWAEERKEGRLPPHDPRPYFARHCSPATKPIVLAVEPPLVELGPGSVSFITTIESLEFDNDLDVEDDLSDAFTAPTANVSACADSLAALRAAHPDLAHPIEYVTKDRGKTFQALPHPMVARELWVRPQSQQSA